MTNDLFSYVKHARLAIGLAATLGLLAVAATIAQMSLLSQSIAGAFIGHQSIGSLAPLLGALLAAIVARAGLLWAQEIAAQRAAIRVKTELRARLLAHLRELGPAFSTGERTGELVATASAGIERLDAYVARYVPQVALSVLVPLLVAGYVLTLDRASAALLLATAPVIPLLMVLIGSYAEGHIQRQWLALARLSASFLDALQGLTTLKTFNRAAAERAHMARVGEEYRDRTMKVLRLAFLSGTVLELMSAIAIALVAVMLGVRLLDGGIAFQRALLILLLAPEFYRPLRDLGLHRHAGLEGQAAATRIFELLRTPAPAQAGTGAAWRPPGPVAVELHAVTYRYSDAARPALHDLTLTLEAGSCTALVGRSGAGKSTLVNLLLRFADPQDGRIMADGLPINALAAETWRENVALVPQRPHLFYGSVLDNIRLARPQATRREVECAAEMAGAAEFIAALPQGYETPIGERGARLSAGQAQRLAIARAFLKDAPLLILDEPTSNLDPLAEALVRQALERLMHDRTVLMIAHRLSTVRRAQRIAVLDAGRLVETGSHEELLAHGDAYARLLGASRGVTV